MLRMSITREPASITALFVSDEVAMAGCLYVYYRVFPVPPVVIALIASVDQAQPTLRQIIVMAPTTRANKRPTSRRSHRSGRRVRERRQRYHEHARREELEFYEWVYHAYFRAPASTPPQSARRIVEAHLRAGPSVGPYRSSAGTQTESQPSIPNYAPRIDPDLDEHAYSPTPAHVESDSDLLPEPIIKSEIDTETDYTYEYADDPQLMPKEEVQWDQSDPAPSVEIQPSNLCDNGLFYIPVTTGPQCTDPGYIESNPLVSQIIQGCSHHIFEFVPPASTVEIEEL